MEQENSEKLIIRLSIIFFSVVITLLVGNYILIDRKIDNAVDKIVEQNQPVFDETVVDLEKTYTLKEYNGKIGVYENDSLMYVLDTYVFTLPEKDKKLLNSGISVSTKEELYKLLELYY